MMKNNAIRFIYSWIAFLLAAFWILKIPVCAEPASAQTEIQLIVQDAGQKKQDAVTLNGLRITVKEETEAEERPQDGDTADPRSAPAPYEKAAVIAAEGIEWEIPLFWIDDKNIFAEKREPGRIYKPVLAFFVPDEYAVHSDTGTGFTVTLDAWLSALYEKAGGAVCFYEPNTNITYIVAAGADLSFLDGEEGKLPAEPIPGLPDDLRKPTDGKYRNPSLNGSTSFSGEEEEPGRSSGISNGRGEQESEEKTGQSGKIDESDAGNSSSQTDESGEGNSPSQEEEPSEEDSGEASGDVPEEGGEQPPLTREQLLAHCAGNTLNKYGEDEMANLVDLIINCIQPQAVELIKSKFPVFAGAAEEGALGKEIGLYVYRMFGEKDGVKAHEETSSKALAYVSYQIDEDGKGGVQLGYILGLNTFYFQTRDKEGNLHIDTSEQAASDLDNSIIHEMFHAFMCDYNRTGTIGTPDPEMYLQAGKKLQESRDVYEFPYWFKEGIASAVENNYQYRYEYFQLLRYEGEGTIGARQTAENLLNAYLTRLFLLEDDVEYEDNFDIGAAEATSTSVYVTGYLADLYLGEMAARQVNASSVNLDGNGRRQVSSEAIRMGLNSILERLHKGETLDQIIRSISDGRYQDVSDFEQKFIKGADQKGDRDSVSFCVDFLNYMLDIGAVNTYIPNGSILFDFDRDFTTPIDRSVKMKTDLYQITDSSDYTASTVILETPYTDGGKSLPQGAGEDAAKSAAGSINVLLSAKESTPAEEGESSGLSESSINSSEDCSDLESAGEETAGLTEPTEPTESTEGYPSTVVESEERPEEGAPTDREPEESAEENPLPENEPAECTEESPLPENEPAECTEESPLPENGPAEYAEESPLPENGPGGYAEDNS